MAGRQVGWKVALVAAAVTAAALTALTAAGPASASGAQPARTGQQARTGQPAGVPGSIGYVPPAAGGPERAGTITVAEYAGGAPNWILPIVPDNDAYTYNANTFSWEMWRPVYWSVDGVTPELDQAMSLAYPPVYSDGDRQVSITFKSSYPWSDGTPVTADDLLFDIDLIKAAVRTSPSDWSDYIPGNFPDNLASAATSGERTLVLHVSQPVNPQYFTQDILSQLNPLPAQRWDVDSANGPAITDWATNPADALKIYGYLSARSGSLNTYATNPLWQVVDGPYRLSAFNAISGNYTLTPNSAYGGPHATTMSTIEGIPFTSDTAEFDAILAGSIDVGYVPDYQGFPTLMSGTGYHYFGEATFAYYYASFNFKDQTGHFGAIASQLYFRQAMAHLENQRGWIRNNLYGAGAPDYGPVPVYPSSPYLPQDAASDPYPFNVQAAIALLKSHGWTVRPGGTDVCDDAGTGAGQCGAGIPAGTRLAFSLIYDDEWPIAYEVQDLAGQAHKAGIAIGLQPSTSTYILNHDSDSQYPAYDNAWAMQDCCYSLPADYPTTFGTFNTSAAGQAGDYSNPTADALINASISGPDPAAARNEASFLTENLPVLFTPVPDDIVAWKPSVSGPPASFENLTQYDMTPEFWYLTS
jgi:peptide/nickel transport system substrate-binding protein